MARVKRFFAGLSGLIAYPRSVFDLSPIDRMHFPAMDDAASLCGDWMAICGDVKKTAWRIYVHG